MEEIHKRLKQLRKERGVTLNSLAEKMGVDYQQLSRIERGKSRLNINVLMKMADALETPISEIVNTKQEVVKVIPQERPSYPLNDSQELLGKILEKIEIILEENNTTLRPQTKAALATQIYTQAMNWKATHLSTEEIIAFSVGLIEAIIAEKKSSYS
jgi:transcriptional regulator with XRE-family HTH domain